MDIVSRAQAICLKPKDEWAKIKGETTPVKELFTSYAFILAAIPAIALFLEKLLFGYKIPTIGGWVSYGIGRAFLFAIFYYVFFLIVVYVLGLIINALAPNFSSTPNMMNAMKLAVYSFTPIWVAGVLYIIPFLGILVIFAGLYGLYVLYLGFATPLMDTPKEKVLGYFAVTVVVAIVLWIIVSVVLGAIFTAGAILRGI